MVLQTPALPTVEEREAHRAAGHHPAAAWCEDCVRGRGVEEPHRRRPAEKEDAPLLELDYSFLDDAGDQAPKEVKTATTISLYDQSTQLGITSALESKTGNMVYILGLLTGFLDSLGHTRARLRTDGEPSIVMVAERLRRERPGLILEQAPRYSSQSLGGVGRYQRSLLEDVRTLKSEVEMAYGAEIASSSAVWPWLVRHAAWARARFANHAGGRTSFEQAFDMKYRGSVVPFGETVLYKEPAQSQGRLPQGRRQGKAAI